jgi:hypothetical protein
LQILGHGQDLIEFAKIHTLESLHFFFKKKKIIKGNIGILKVLKIFHVKILINGGHCFKSWIP